MLKWLSVGRLPHKDGVGDNGELRVWLLLDELQAETVSSL